MLPAARWRRRATSLYTSQTRPAQTRISGTKREQWPEEENEQQGNAAAGTPEQGNEPSNLGTTNEEWKEDNWSNF